MTVEITPIDDKVTRIHFVENWIMPIGASAIVLYEDDHAMLTRVTFRLGDHEWHDHILHEFAEPAA